MSVKRSKQREQIYQLIQQSAGHMTADDIHTKLKEADIVVGIATVYRNLNYLFDHGMVNRISHPDLGYIYDKNTHDHYHFRCLECNEMFDVNVPFQNQFNDLVEAELDCIVMKHEIIFEGICKSCRNQKSTNKQ